MPSELPVHLDAQVCEAVCRLRFNHLSGDQVVQLASNLLVANIDTPSVIALASHPYGLSLRDLLPIFERMLEELGYPPLRSLQPWWLGPRLKALKTTKVILPGQQSLWLAIVNVSPSFGLIWDPFIWDPFESDYVVAGILARQMVALLKTGSHKEQLDGMFEIIEQYLTKGKLWRDLIVAGILEGLMGDLAREGIQTSSIEQLLGAGTALAWRSLSGGNRPDLHLVQREQDVLPGTEPPRV